MFTDDASIFTTVTYIQGIGWRAKTKSGNHDMEIIFKMVISIPGISRYDLLSFVPCH
jgi:hypothetical protein